MIKFNNFDDAVEMLISEFDANGSVQVSVYHPSLIAGKLLDLTNDDVFELMHEDTEFMFELSRELKNADDSNPSAYEIHDNKFEEVKVKLITDMLKKAGY